MPAIENFTVVNRPCFFGLRFQCGLFNFPIVRRFAIWLETRWHPTEAERKAKDISKAIDDRKRLGEDVSIEPPKELEQLDDLRSPMNALV